MPLDMLKTSSNVKEEKDSVGGTTFLVNSGIRTMDIEAAFLGKSTGGAMSLTLHLKDTEAVIRETLWVTSGDAKGNKTFYVDKNGDEQYLPGFNAANALCLLTLGKEISEMTPEKKVINLYSFIEKKEIPTEVEMIMALVGQSITVGIIKNLVDKTKKNETTGKYEPTGETREVNEIDKMFRVRDGLTVAEIKAQVTEAQFIKDWADKNTDKVRDKSTKVAGSGATAGAPASTEVKTKSLFE